MNDKIEVNYQKTTSTIRSGDIDPGSDKNDLIVGHLEDPSMRLENIIIEPLMHEKEIVSLPVLNSVTKFIRKDKQ